MEQSGTTVPGGRDDGCLCCARDGRQMLVELVGNIERTLLDEEPRSVLSSDDVLAARPTILRHSTIATVLYLPFIRYYLRVLQLSIITRRHFQSYRLPHVTCQSS